VTINETYKFQVHCIGFHHTCSVVQTDTTNRIAEWASQQDELFSSLSSANRRWAPFFPCCSAYRSFRVVKADMRRLFAASNAAILCSCASMTLCLCDNASDIFCCSRRSSSSTEINLKFKKPNVVSGMGSSGHTKWVRGEVSNWSIRKESSQKDLRLPRRSLATVFKGVMSEFGLAKNNGEGWK